MSNKDKFLNPLPCVAIILKTPDKKFLFIERSKDPDKGKLDFPGSFIREGETAELAAVRVLKQELSLSDTILTLFGSSTDYYGGDKNMPILSILLAGNLTESEYQKIIPMNDAASIKILSYSEIDVKSLAYKSMLDEIKILEAFE